MRRYYQVLREKTSKTTSRWLVVDIRERSRFGRRSVAEVFTSRDQARAKARQLNAEAIAATSGSNAELRTQ